MHVEERPEASGLEREPEVALTIDTEVHRPKILLIRGRAELDFVDGIPDEYLQATHLRDDPRAIGSSGREGVFSEVYSMDSWGGRHAGNARVMTASRAHRPRQTDAGNVLAFLIELEKDY